MLPQQYCLRWKYHHSNLQTMFSQLLDRGCFCDVTLACEGQLIRAHRVVLCACSTFFDTVLTNYASERDPIIIMKDVTFADVKCLIEFMYKGEINVEHAHLASLLKTADDLKIKGLAEVSWRDDDDVNAPPPPTPATEFQSPPPLPLTTASAASARHGSLAEVYAMGQGSPSAMSGVDRDRRSPSPVSSSQIHMPALTPMPHGAGVGVGAGGGGGGGLGVGGSSSVLTVGASMAENYLGPKRKRGRPPLDDAYDVFNIRKLAQYAAHMDHQAYLEARHYADEQRQQLAAVASAVSPETAAAAAVAYQQHIQQQQQQQQQNQTKQRQRHHHAQHHGHHQQQQRSHQMPHHRPSESDETEHEDVPTDSEWISSNLEVNVSEGEPCAPLAMDCRRSGGGQEDEQRDRDREKESRKHKLCLDDIEQDISITRVVDKKKQRQHNQSHQAHRSSASPSSSPSSRREKPRKVSREEEQDQAIDARRMSEKRDDESPENDEDHDVDVPSSGAVAPPSANTVPRTVEEMESVEQKPSVSGGVAASPSGSPNSAPSISSSTTSSPSTTGTATSVTSSSSATVTSGSSASVASAPPPPPPPSSSSSSSSAFYSKYAPEGYLLNEHGMLMTHDAFVHAPTVAIPTTISGASSSAAVASASAAAASSANGNHHDHEFVDIKMEDYDAADLRLTSEEMSQWKDVIKMDDYLAKGRRPQFWEEPFTRRVLDAIKNKRLEMKKAARILGVSYGTLYGRYREVYGCLKHPYSNATGSFRSSQPSDLSVQSRLSFDWLPPKRDGPLLPGQLEIGKIRPKDLSELWARPQI